MAQMQDQTSPAASPADYAARNRSPGTGDAGAGDGGLFHSAAESVKDKARSLAEEQKEQGAERIDAFGRVVHGVAEELGKEIPQAAGYIHSAADRLQDASARLREGSVDDLVARLQHLARKQPAATFAGSVLAGLALSRFLKSSSR
jgi:hypothetical protein